MTTRVVKGSVWTLGGQIAPLLLSFITAPFVIDMLGADGYGVLILIGVLPSYFLFADFGMGMASTKFGSQAYSAGDPEQEGRVVRTAALIAFLASLPVAALLFVFSSWLARLFNVPEDLLADASIAIKIVSVTFVINFLNGILNTPQLSRLRMDLNTILTSGFRVVGIIATPVVLYMGFGLAAVASVLLVVSLLTLTGHFFVSKRLLPNLADLTLERELVRPMIVFGGAFVGAGIAAVLIVNAEKGILAAAISPEALAFYQIAFTVAAILPMFSVSMLQSLIPAFSQLQGDENREQLNALFKRALRLNIIGSIPALILVAIVAKTFFTLWIDERFGRESTLPLYILLIGVAFGLLAHMPYVSILAAGRTDIFAKLYWLQLAAYVPLVWFLTTKFGIPGAAAAWSIRTIVDTFILFSIARRTAGVSFGFSQFARFLIPVSVMIVPLITYFYRGQIDALVISLTAICLAAYAIVIWRTVLEPEEIAWIESRLVFKS